MSVLRSKILGESDQKLIILHGLYGSSDSWIRVAREISENFQVHLLDQRNHGESFYSDSHTYSNMTEDLRNYLDSQSISKAIIVGHSMGGKVAMYFADKYPEYISKMIVADISPRSHKSLLENDNTSNFHLNLLSLMSSLKLEDYKEYRQISKELLPYGETVKNVVLKNIAKVNGVFKWKINVQSLLNNLPYIMEGFNPDDFIDKKIDVKTLFLKAKNSDYITKSDIKLIEFIFTNYYISEINNAGHWLHYDNPIETIKAIKEFLI